MTVTMFLPLLLALTLLFTGVGGGALPQLQDLDFHYDYAAAYNLSGKTGSISADLSLDHGAPTLHFSDGEHVLFLQNGIFSLTSASGASSSPLSDTDMKMIAELVQYVCDGRLQRDMETLTPYLSDILSYNAYSLHTSQTERDDAFLTHFEIDTTPMRLLGAFQRWLMIRSMDPRMKGDLDRLELVRLPSVQAALANSGVTLSDFVSQRLKDLALSFSSVFSSSGAGIAMMPIRLEGEWDTTDNVLHSARLQFGDMASLRGVLVASYTRAWEGADSTFTLSLYTQEQDGGSLFVSWPANEAWLQADASWRFGSTGGDFSFRGETFARDWSRPIQPFEMNLSMYGMYNAPSLTLRYTDGQLSFLYINNSSSVSYSVPSYSYVPGAVDTTSWDTAEADWDSTWEAVDEVQEAAAASWDTAEADWDSTWEAVDEVQEAAATEECWDQDAVNYGVPADSEYYAYASPDQAPYLMGTLAWDGGAYALSVQSSAFTLEGQGAYEWDGGSFHQKGDFLLTLLSGGASSRMEFTLEQTLAEESDVFRLTQHLEGGPAGVSVPMLTYDDRHALTLR